ncbi:ABC transporter ATP-binding protein [Arenimonas sp.]|nr:ABC transporter ATP-binding protein [Candidatus Parcubacteria bacterium]
MKFIYIVNEYIKVAFKCLKYVYSINKKGTVFRLGVLILFPVLSNVINIINARLANSMQQSYGTGVMKYILPIFGFLIVFTFLESFFSFLSNKLSISMQRKLNDQVFTDQLSKKKDFTIPFIDSSDYEELRQRIEINGEGRYAQVAVTNSIPEFLSIVVNLIFTIYITYSYDWKFATLILLASLPGFYISFTRSFVMRKNWENHLDDNKYYSIYSGMFMNYQSLKDAKSSNNTNMFIKKYRDWKDGFTNSQIKIQNKYSNLVFLSGMLMTFIIFTIQFFVIKDVVAGAMLIGSATLVIVQVSRLESYISRLSWFLPEQYENVVTSKYLFLQAETIENTDKITGSEFYTENDTIEFKNINFKYEDTKFTSLHKLNDEIDNIAVKYFGLKKQDQIIKEKDGSNFNLYIDNLVINKGEKIAIVGKNGNGKTTFIQLLLNIYQPTSGEILLFGNNLKNLSQETILNNFSALYQDYSQQSLKTHEYIALSEKGEIDMDKIKSSSKIATADEFIEKWDNQYTQQLGVYMKGVKPSKGQWQKLALARTFYKDSPVIILDEPTASIDATSSKKIFENLKDIDKSKTLIIISHNMTDIAKFVDRIIIFDKGRIVGDGTHKELLKSSPVYKDLYESESR